jgi:hypothetical protein
MNIGVAMICQHQRLRVRIATNLEFYVQSDDMPHGRYRFHSSFLMPRGASLGYLQSTFTGQLPQAFATCNNLVVVALKPFVLY